MCCCSHGALDSTNFATISSIEALFPWTTSRNSWSPSKRPTCWIRLFCWYKAFGCPCGTPPVGASTSGRFGFVTCHWSSKRLRAMLCCWSFCCCCCCCCYIKSGLTKRCSPSIIAWGCFLTGCTDSFLTLGCGGTPWIVGTQEGAFGWFLNHLWWLIWSVCLIEFWLQH